MLGNFACSFFFFFFFFFFLSFKDFFFGGGGGDFFQKNLSGIPSMSNSLDPDPDRGPNCLQRLSADGKSCH